MNSLILEHIAAVLQVFSTLVTLMLVRLLHINTHNQLAALAASHVTVAWVH